MKDTENIVHKRLHWISAPTARRMLAPYIKDSFINVWSLDLFTLYRALTHTYPDTLFFLVDNEDEEFERLEVLDD